MREQSIVLENHPDAAGSEREMDVLLGVEPRGTVDANPAGIGPVESGDQSQKAGLPGAGRPENHAAFAIEFHSNVQPQGRMNLPGHGRLQAGTHRPAPRAGWTFWTRARAAMDVAAMSAEKSQAISV